MPHLPVPTIPAPEPTSAELRAAIERSVKRLEAEAAWYAAHPLGAEQAEHFTKLAAEFRRMAETQPGDAGE